MAERDKLMIAALIRRNRQISRIEIHRLTNLRPATISKLTKELIDEGRIEEAGRSDNPTGRKQVLLRSNTRFGFVVSVDFDAEHVRAALIDLEPRVHGPVVQEPTVLDLGKDGLIAQLLRCTHRAIESSGVACDRVLGIGVGDPGLVNVSDGMSVAASTIEFWQHVPLRQIFEDEFAKSTLIASNTCAMAVAERSLGAGASSEDMIFVEYGRGIGCGIITGGRLLEGSQGAAGEFGHTHVTEDGPACRCGSFGCLEAIAGIGALEAKARRAISQGGFSHALSLAGGEVDHLTGWHVLQAARDGDKMSVALVEGVANYLGLGLANLANLFNPSLIVLDERLSLAGDGFLEQIKRVVQRQALGHVTETLQFRYASLGDEAGLLGPALLVLERIFEMQPTHPVSRSSKTVSRQKDSQAAIHA
jgi:predicted NBD/HSP70 family sugar kinase